MEKYGGIECLREYENTDNNTIDKIKCRMKLAMLLVIGIFLFSVGGCLYEQTYENMADLGIMVAEAEIVNLGAFASNLHFDVSGLLRNQTGIARVIAFAFVVCGGTFYYFRHHLPLVGHLEKKDCMDYHNTDEMLQHIRHLEEQLQICGSRLAESENRCRQLEVENEQLFSKLRGLEEDEQSKQLVKQRFSNSDACLLFRKKEVKGERITEDDWQQLEMEADSLLDGFIGKLTSGPVRVSRQELRASLLIRAGFSIKTIASFLNLSPAAVSYMRRRLCIKFILPEATPQTWDNFVRSL